MTVLKMPKEIPSLKPVVSFETFYEQGFLLAARFVSKMNGTFQDAKDLYHDALIIYHEKLQDENFYIRVAEEAYVLGIVKHLWLRKFNHSRSMVSLNDYEAAISIPDDYTEGPDENKLMNFLETFGKKCLHLLTAFYTEKKSMREIMKKFGYSNEHSATVQKFKCIEKIKNTIKEKSIIYNDFI